MSNVTDTYDRLHGVTDMTKEEWNFSCPYCESSHLEISPIDVPYRPHDIHDFSDLPPNAAYYFSKLPTILEAIISCSEDVKGTSVCVGCVDCGMSVSGFVNLCNGALQPASVNKAKLRKYVRKFYGVNEVMLL